MKKFKQNPLLNVELKATPLTQDAEGKLLGGFVGMQGAKAAEGKNAPCYNRGCTNAPCTNNGCDNYICVNDVCKNITTATQTPTSTDTTTATYAPGLLFF
jgi:hypothetical protein